MNVDRCLCAVVVRCFGTSRTACLGRWRRLCGRTASCRSTARTTPTCSSTCAALSAAFCPSVARRTTSSRTVTASGTYRMRWTISCRSVVTTTCWVWWIASQLTQHVSYAFIYLLLFSVSMNWSETDCMAPESVKKVKPTIFSSKYWFLFCTTITEMKQPHAQIKDLNEGNPLWQVTETVLVI